MRKKEKNLNAQKVAEVAQEKVTEDNKDKNAQIKVQNVEKSDAQENEKKSKRKKK